ncbi:MAG: LacI family transcriptional regulator [Actinomyces ruminicola]|uniref:Transcriptional regulator, LacI family n=1 Tax=Actinomyces ruminicola TaxID=332524 RepID=A0A1G9YJ71_9ACTO|nr:LacI family DNA-binding transcriptional regulator [Actinomyces ruminicola]MBE6482962.1 LacI family transcriptional regulator [Actinomyces ruminicola]SDN08962.1 transcriptional regulator, LacI family [Actinomyces ruminicola]
MEPRQRVTLDDVAAAAGVSKSAASKALNNRADVSAATRERVLAASEDLGYVRPETTPVRSYPQIAMVSDDLATAYTIEVLKGAATAALNAGVALNTTYTPEPAPHEHPVPFEPEWFTLLKSTDHIGLIVLTSPLTREQHTSARRIGLPVVLIDPSGPQERGVASIGATNWNGGVDATEYLIGLGHERIALVGGPQDSVPARERHQGYLSALQMHSLPVRAELISSGPYSYDNGLRQGRRLLSLPEGQRPTAVFAASDTTALGIYEAAREAGLRIPEDFSVVGFDDAEMAGWAAPRLTTVRQPLFRMGQEAVRMIVDNHRGRPLLTTTPVRLSTRLVIRDSAAPPR